MTRTPLSESQVTSLEFVQGSFGYVPLCARLSLPILYLSWVNDRFTPLLELAAILNLEATTKKLLNFARVATWTNIKEFVAAYSISSSIVHSVNSFHGVLSFVRLLVLWQSCTCRGSLLRFGTS